jgi:hypothetical protein
VREARNLLCRLHRQRVAAMTVALTRWPDFIDVALNA